MKEQRRIIPPIDHFSGTLSLDQAERVITDRLLTLPFVKKRQADKYVEYLNAAIAFDIETSSFYEGEEKRAIMYGWTCNINGEVIIGRTWDELITLTDMMVDMLELNSERRVIIYIHNAAFEFQFMRKWFEFIDVFALSERKPVYALTDTGIEFRCSYILTGYRLEKLADLLVKYPVRKMSGDLDYKKIRHSGTPLTDKEVKYMENDVRVVANYIQEQIEKEGAITKILLTKTGYVRRFCRNACLYGNVRNHKRAYQYHKYMRIIKPLTLEVDEYDQLKNAFQGGFTHANAYHADKLLTDISSYDFTSSYPAVMVAEKFPMGKGEVIEIKSKADLHYNLIRYCCLFDIEFRGIYSDNVIDYPISKSKCRDVINASIDNGRIVSADRIRITLTGEDFEIIDKFYKWESMAIGTFRRYVKGYLPTDFVKCILELYKDKTELKGVQGEEERYNNSKEQLNSCYGMAVTDIVRDEITYSSGEWKSDTPSTSVKLEKENNSSRRFLFYPWGVWVTAYARRNLFTAIYEAGTDYVYSDTDSIKLMNAETHAKYFEDYNNEITSKLERALDHHKIPHDYIRPYTVKGKCKPLGVWDYEGRYSKFKTLGAKRYMIELDGEISFTVSGVNKKYAIPYLLKKYGRDKIFDVFADGLHIPKGATGKSTHTYIDEETKGTVTDYKGIKRKYYERSSLHLEECEYDMTLSREYADRLKGIKECIK